ncbi:MAG: biopolymer transporter ExbD [Deltaproteobacteria bacterium]|nr:biopolymer transporter ExbD [Deltaproteobacteria bacterium]
MAGAIGNDDEPITAINVTPLVDIVLVLLIIFMITATFIANPQIKVELPKAATGEAAEPKSFAIILTKDGKYYLDGELKTIPEIESYIRERKAEQPDTQAIISADKEVEHGHVILMIDLVRRNGVTNFAINVDPAAVEEMRAEEKAAETSPTAPAPAADGA